MRRLLVLALSAAALAAGGTAASAEDTCTPWVGHWLIANARVCTELTCEEICGPDFVPDPECQPGIRPPQVVAATCVLVDAL